nr:uncharacterized protein LOC117280478 [Nicotiana tomentosiformis]
MARNRNSDTDTQDAAQETIVTIVAQEGVEHDEQVPQDLVPPTTAVPAQTTISPDVGQMFNVANSAMEMFKAFMANQNEIRDEIPPQLNRQNNSESLRVNEFLKMSPPLFRGTIVDEYPMLWLEGVKKSLRAMKAFNDEAMELAAYQLRDVAGAWFEMWEKERDEDDGPPTWEEFEEAFMANFIPEEDREAKATEFEQLKQGNKSVQEYYMKFISLAKHAPHMFKTEKAKIPRFIGGLAYHIKDTTSAAAVGMIAFSFVMGFSKHLEKDRQQRREEKEHNMKSQTTGGFNGTSSGGGRGSYNKESLAPAQSSQQSGQCKLGFHSCYHCGDIGHIKANCPKLRRNFSGGSTRPSSSSAIIVALPHARGSHNQAGHGAGRGADRVTHGGGQPCLCATLDRQNAEASAEVITYILLVCSYNDYAIIDPSSTFSYVTPYFSINLRLELEQLREPLLVSTPSIYSSWRVSKNNKSIEVV